MQNKKRKGTRQNKSQFHFHRFDVRKRYPTDIIAVRVEKVKKIRGFTPYFRTC